MAHAVQVVQQRLLHGQVEQVGAQLAQPGRAAQLLHREVDAVQHADVGPHPAPEKTTVIAPRLHGQRKGRQRRRTRVDFHAVEILFQDQPRDVGRVVAFFLVDGVEQVEGIEQHVAGAGRAVANAQFLRRAYGHDISCPFRVGGVLVWVDTMYRVRTRCVVLRRDVVFHALRQPRLRPVRHPQPAQRVVDQEAHDPVRRVERGFGRQFVWLNLAARLDLLVHRLLFFGDVELVEPADHLLILAGVGGQRIPHRLQDRPFREQVVGHEQFSVVGNRLEEEGHRAVIAVACAYQQQTIGFLLRLARRQPSAQQIEDALAIHRQGIVDVALLGLLQQLRLREALCRRDDAQRGVVVHVHKAQRAEAVEPGVGHPLHHGRAGGRLDLVLEFLHGRGVLAQFGAVRAQDALQPRGHLFVQLAPGGAGETFECACVHD